ncbi:Gamma-interferon-inducible lysosomal thiol reductase [Orchesella cincta]|uniref:Gamma-interferon-inducible lysosomal thiol reductase n=1 Tax=Orchesella cincta TaxID=48709 RepID=A0A1D2MGP6_ORCCI|nr:Gamma-interferon-inducible lysosomal thiol reductase [Orchesella cincta]
MGKLVNNLITLGILVVSINLWITYAAHIKLVVHYEPLCPHSRKFVTKTLYPLFISLGGAYNGWLDVELYPYGKALTEWKDGWLSITCQHGKPECALGKQQACANRKLPHEKALAFQNCTLKNPLAAVECGNELFGNDYEKVKTCGESWEGDVLYAANGIMVRNLHPPLIDVPRITLDGHFTPHEYHPAQKDWLGLLCKQWMLMGVTLPPNCDGKTFVGTRKDYSFRFLIPALEAFGNRTIYENVNDLSFMTKPIFWYARKKLFFWAQVQTQIAWMVDTGIYSWFGKNHDVRCQLEILKGVNKQLGSQKHWNFFSYASQKVGLGGSNMDRINGRSGMPISNGVAHDMVQMEELKNVFTMFQFLSACCMFFCICEYLLRQWSV